MKKDVVFTELTPEERAFYERYFDLADQRTMVTKTGQVFNIEVLDDHAISNLLNLKRVNSIRRINKFFESVNSKLPVGGHFAGICETAQDRKERILKRYPPIINRIYYFFDFVFKRIFPKLLLTKRLYFIITNGRNRVLSRTEVLGRLASCGFKILAEEVINGNLHFVVRKKGDPLFPKNPSYGPLFRMRRVGKDGKIIGVYKMRTMHPYSEFLQEYINETQGLDEGGKFKDDPRVTSWGRFLRRFWLDELPMIINLVKGDMKIVGVRPLSSHYMSLYTEELRQKRIKVKPGLVPPYYADMPKTLEEIMESEHRYLDAYMKHPLRTDLRYVWLTFYNIVVKKARSK